MFLFVKFNCMGIDAYITFTGKYMAGEGYHRVSRDIVSFCMYSIQKMIKIKKNICITLMQYVCITYRSPGEVVIIFRTLSKKAIKLYICLKVYRSHPLYVGKHKQ